jgi:hypothetical protein
MLIVPLTFVRKSSRILDMEKELGKVSQAARKASASSQARDEAIRQAHLAGFSIRAIAVAAELSSARVHQIIHNR